MQTTTALECEQRCLSHIECHEYNFEPKASENSCGLFKAGCTPASNTDLHWYNCYKTGIPIDLYVYCK